MWSPICHWWRHGGTRDLHNGDSNSADYFLLPCWHWVVPECTVHTVKSVWLILTASADGLGTSFAQVQLRSILLNCSDCGCRTLCILSKIKNAMTSKLIKSVWNLNNARMKAGFPIESLVHIFKEISWGDTVPLRIIFCIMFLVSGMFKSQLSFYKLPISPGNRQLQFWECKIVAAIRSGCAHLHGVKAFVLTLVSFGVRVDFWWGWSKGKRSCAIGRE